MLLFCVVENKRQCQEEAGKNSDEEKKGPVAHLPVSPVYCTNYFVPMNTMGLLICTVWFTFKCFSRFSCLGWITTLRPDFCVAVDWSSYYYVYFFFFNGRAVTILPLAVDNLFYKGNMKWHTD